MRRILVVGGGGREHALAWRLAQSPTVETVWVAPGNAGTAAEPGVQNVALAATDISGLLDFAQTESIDYLVVGPELPISLGIADAAKRQGVACFAPSQAAAQLESSKVYAKAFMQRHGIPTADYQVCQDREEAERYCQQQSFPLVIKADGLAAGKGVIIATSNDEARLALKAIYDDDCFGDAGRQVVIESFLTGSEMSFMAIVSGQTVIPLATSQDHKRRDAGDLGPNTGGMGAYSPVPMSATLAQHIQTTIVEPTVAGLAAEGHEYLGFLYVGLMVDASGTPRVLEYNCRLGDPETQPLMMRLQSDLAQVIADALDRRLVAQCLCWDPRMALSVVLASEGYPGTYQSGYPIDGLSALPDHFDGKVFHSGTTMNAAETVTQGGRVLAVTGLADSLPRAQASVYAICDTIRWPGRFYRDDIGHQAATWAHGL